jgi:S-adenosylmethionine-diacylglycerol 3-amino-3-carboxypropyl transferase
MFSQTKDRYNLSLCMLHTMLLEKVAFLMQLVIGGVSAVTRTVLSRMGMVDRATKTRACTDSGVKDTADFSKIRYSQVWEDTDTLRQALDVKSGEHVFSIASAGDNLFALLLDDPAKLVALDFNASQVWRMLKLDLNSKYAFSFATKLALCALKIAAFKHLTYPEFVHLLGFRFSDPIKMSPSQMYAERLRPHLAPQYRDFWDANLVLLDRGVVHTGRLESYWSIWR